MADASPSHTRNGLGLFYYRDPSGTGNFGDDLNPFLFGKLIPELLEPIEKAEAILVGIGTLLNDRLPRAAKTAVFSSGVGYGAGLPIMDDSWTVYCVRGPLSAKKLGLSPDAAVADGAILVRDVFRANTSQRKQVGFMPHVTTATGGAETIKLLCAEFDLKYIDPRESVEEVLTAITGCELIVTEALHGALVAETYRIPWIPWRSTSDLLPFKWLDCCGSLGLAYRPRRLIRLWDAAAATTTSSLHGRRWMKFVIARRQLRGMLKSGRPCLSMETRYRSLRTQLSHRLDSLRRDVERGYFE